MTNIELVLKGIKFDDGENPVYIKELHFEVPQETIFKWVFEGQNIMEVLKWINWKT